MFFTKEEVEELKKEHIEKFTEWENNKFVILPEHILFSDELTTGEVVFYAKLISLSNKSNGTLLHGNDTLSESLNCSVSNIKKYLDSLKKKDLIQTLSTGPHSKRIICLTPYN